MSNTKTVMGQASNQYVKPLDITDVFSTYLYDGTGAAQTITNGIDLAGEGGLVWTKSRTTTSAHGLYDTIRGVSKEISSSSTVAQSTDNGVTAFNSNGYTVGNRHTTNTSAANYASWTFRKAPKFFDVVTYTGTGDTTTQTISHNLGAVPGCIIVKRTDSADSWRVYHRGVDVNGDGQPWTDMLTLNTTAAASDFPVWGDTAPTSTEFTVGYESSVNGSGGTYVAYVFAHNDGDGGFGPDADQDIIKCGSYTGTGSQVDVDLGFEPQWILTRRADDPDDWYMLDTMRGIATSGDDAYLRANLSSSEGTGVDIFDVTATGFKTKVSSRHTNGGTYIYMAIRRGPLAPPESGTEVFDIATRGAVSGEPGFRSDTGVVDMALVKTVNTSSDWSAKSRLTQGKYLVTNSSAAETSLSYAMFDYMNGHSAFDGTNSNTHSWMWKRAPGFFDVVAYTGTNVAGLTINHNLGVVPEMIWVKNRSAAEYWAVYHKDLNGGTNPSHYFLRLNTTNAETDYNEIWNDTEPTATQFTVGQQGVVNGFEQNHIAYLFATLPGVSKVGSYSGDGTTDGSKVIDCGFTSGARFVLIKAYNTGGDWMVYDTTRGIVVGNDPILSLNDTAAEATTYDNLIPNSSGFAVIQNTDGAYTTNESGHSYIFYAIA